MAYKVTNFVGAQAFNENSTEQKHPLGYRVKGTDPVFGEGEFIYLKGLASTAVGDAVTWDEAFATTRLVGATRGPVGVAMSACVANQFGWYQIAGVGIATALAVVADAGVSSSATPGSLDDLTTAGQGIDGAKWMAATDTPSAGKAYIMLQYPAANGGTVA